jgi:hypothetical protein
MLQDTNFQAKPMKIKRIWVVLAAIVIAIIFYFGDQFDRKRINSLYVHKKLTTGRVIDYTRSAYYYVYNINNKTYERSFYCYSGYLPINLLGQQLPVVYDSLNPSFSELIFLRSDFKKYNFPFPDSLAKYQP